MSTTSVCRSVVTVISRTAVSYGTVTAAELDRFRERADRFIAEQDEEYYLHFSGRKPALELEPIYERYTDLTTLEQAKALEAEVNGGSGVRELWRFACEG